MIGGTDLTKGKDETIYCDTASDVSGLETFARENELRQGSVAYVIETGEVYIMKSDYSWVKQ